MGEASERDGKNEWSDHNILLPSPRKPTLPCFSLKAGMASFLCLMEAAAVISIILSSSVPMPFMEARSPSARAPASWPLLPLTVGRSLADSRISHSSTVVGVGRGSSLGSSLAAAAAAPSLVLASVLGLAAAVFFVGDAPPFFSG